MWLQYKAGLWEIFSYYTATNLRLNRHSGSSASPSHSDGHALARRSLRPAEPRVFGWEEWLRLCTQWDLVKILNHRAIANAYLSSCQEAVGAHGELTPLEFHDFWVGTVHAFHASPVCPRAVL